MTQIPPPKFHPEMQAALLDPDDAILGDGLS